MKYTRLVLLAIQIFISIVIISCDIIEPPYMTNYSSDNGDDGVVVKKILLEEFTGHLCPNCPEGKKVAQQLKELYGKKIVEISIHSGTFAKPLGGAFANDYRTTFGDEITAYFGVNQYPTGMISRTNYEGSTVISPSAWGSAISQIINEEPTIKIKIETAYNATSRKLEIDLTADMLSNLDGSYFITAFIVENGIISPQKTNDPEYPSGVIVDYEHNHVLRAAVNGTWGEKYTETGANTGDSFSFNYSITLNQSWKAENCKVVSYICNGETMEVIQVEEARVTN
ncbi:MAG: Omp28 family outer membrane lipoprotein [Bacteroidetes bacterium]|nr:Omp28 family outer membrane lipoprotein [Bacteroidota bacterium]